MKRYYKDENGKDRVLTFVKLLGFGTWIGKGEDHITSLIVLWEDEHGEPLHLPRRAWKKISYKDIETEQITVASQHRLVLGRTCYILLSYL